MNKVNGVDITDVTRSFDEDEWNRLPVPCRDWIHAKRRELHMKNNNRERNAGAVGTDKEKADGDKPNESAGDLFGRASYGKKK
jgi:hypothetical protein